MLKIVNHFRFEYNVTFFLDFYFSCKQRSMSYESLAYWAGCGSQATIVVVLLF